MRGLFAAGLLLVPLAASAQGDLASACAALAGEARINVAFEDRPASYDHSLGSDALRRLASGATPPHQRVLGLTVAQPTTRLTMAPRIVAERNGRACAVAALDLAISFATLRVYLASELTDACRRRVVDEHEQRHVAVWRDHLRAGARLLETRLRATLGEVAYFANAQQAREVLGRRVEDTVSTYLARIGEGIAAANREIDTASAYQYDQGRLRACP
jgi:hypothetical protein